MEERLIKTHIEAARLLGKVKDDFRKEISDGNIKDEYEGKRFILKRFKEYGLRTDKDCPIVAFGRNTSFVHYFPTTNSLRLKDEMPILLDIWGHIPNGVYADMTWMFYKGRHASPKLLRAFEAVISSRDAMISFLRDSLQDKKLPASNRCDSIVRDALNEHKLGAYFLHSTGHSMTQRLVHGWKSNRGITPRNPNKISKMMPYTVEPGLYFRHLDAPFGVRSEMDFYINKDNKVILTSDVQKELDFILPKGQERLSGF